MSAEKMTILDIAREAGVSPATVSRVMSDHPNVSPKTYQKVRAVVEKYGFTPNRMAAGLQQKSSRTMGIILPNIQHPYYASIFASAQAEANSNGYVVQIYQLAYNARVSDEFVNQLIERRLDGVILAGGFVESTNTASVAAVLNRLQQYMPIVTICPPIPGLSCINIYTDLGEGIRKAVRHLATLGHKRVAFIGATAETRSVGEREQAFVSEMEGLGLTPIMQYENTHSPAVGETATLKLLSGLPRKQWPTALIVINDLMALGVLKQLHNMGMKLPEDMAVIGCDNQFFSAFTLPPLTTIEVAMEEHGRIAMQQLLQARNGETLPFVQVREPSMIVRESCGAQLARRTLPPIPDDE